MLSISWIDIQNPIRALVEDDDEDDSKLDAFLDDDELQEHNEKEKKTSLKSSKMNWMPTVVKLSSSTI